MQRAGAWVCLIALVGCHAIPKASVPAMANVTGANVDTRTDVRTDDEDEGEKDEELIRACAANDPGSMGTGAALDALNQKIQSVDIASDPTELTAELMTMFDAPCLELADGDFSKTNLVFDSALALREWWTEGGLDWLRHYLTLRADRNSIVPLSPRKTLTDNRSSHPLAPLLCPASAVGDYGTSACAPETKGWARRLDKALTREGEARRTKTNDACIEATKGLPTNERYDTFRGCLDELSPKRDALPIGRFKAPLDGWLVMTSEGRCPNVMAYDLATGASYDASGCRGRFSTDVGSVSVSALREAAWALMLSEVAETSIRTRNDSFELPADLEPVRRVGGGGGLSFSGCGGSSSIRSWSWMRVKKGGGGLRGQASGTVNMMGCASDAQKYAVELIEAMEDARATGCAPASPPSAFDWDAPGPGVAAEDKGVARLFVGDAGEALVKARSTGTCTARP